MKEYEKLAEEFCEDWPGDIPPSCEGTYITGFLKAREMAYDIVNKAETSRRVPEMIGEIKALGEKEV